MNLAKRTITSVTWKIIANSVSAVVLFGRSILLARWLPVSVFGIYALALSITKLSVVLADFGMSGALVHRAPETENEDRAAAVQFTFRTGFTLIWAILLLVGTFLSTEPFSQLRTAILLLTLTTAMLQLTSTPSLILLRRVQQRRNAIILLLNTFISTLVVLGLAWNGATLWALLANDCVSVVVQLVMFYGWRPVWKPHFAWDLEVMRYFLDFGRRNFLNAILYQALDRIDDIWVGIFLGETATGFYSKAYSFAIYPRKVLAAPVNWVIGGAYAELKHDRERLSRMFCTVNSILIRSGFFLAGLLALIAPEFIRVLLGEKWLPMLNAFRLMLVFTLLDPIKITIASVIGLAGSRPEWIVRARTVQLVFMLVGLFILGPSQGIVGVAIAVDVMLVVGISILLWQAKSFVDYSLAELFGLPTVALLMGGALCIYINAVIEPTLPSWQIVLLKSGGFSVVYCVVLLLGERRWFVETALYVRDLFVSKDLKEGGLV
jgi:O-antigen/teichoic acid export membrane protein